MPARHPQVRQGKQCHQLRRVLRQATEACLHITELALDHPERVLDLGAHLGLGLLDLALGFVQRAALIQLLDRKSTRLNSSHTVISYAVFCLKK